jgi:hypothetical protein
MAANLCVSVLALVRYDARANGIAAESKWEQRIDAYFGDAVMKQIYPNAIRQ